MKNTIELNTFPLTQIKSTTENLHLGNIYIFIYYPPIYYLLRNISRVLYTGSFSSSLYFSNLCNIWNAQQNTENKIQTFRGASLNKSKLLHVVQFRIFLYLHYFCVLPFITEESIICILVLIISKTLYLSILYICKYILRYITGLHF